MSSPPVILINPNSRKVRREKDLLPALREITHNRAELLETRTLSELPAAMANLHRQRPDLLFVCGGDGTVRATLTELIHTYGRDPLPKIALLRAGTMNTVAEGLGIHTSPLAQLERVLARCDRKLPLSSLLRHPLKINDSFGFIFAIGGFSNFIQRYSKRPDPSPARALWMLTRTTLSSLFHGPYVRALFPRFSTTLRVNQQPFLENVPVVTVAASAIRHIGFGFQPFTYAEGDNGEFGVLTLLTSPRAFLPHLLQIYRGCPFESRTIRQGAARELLIRVDVPTSPMIDGDLLEPRKEFALEVGPAVDFVLG
jgi:diacylglycerol kinase (ATP)